MAKNIALSVAHQQRSWRRERFRGNLSAVYDIARGHFTPERAMRIPRSAPSGTGSR